MKNCTRVNFFWTRKLDAQVAFWQEVFGGQSNERYLSKTVLASPTLHFRAEKPPLN